MIAPTEQAEAVMKTLLPELKKLARNIPAYGEISLKAKIADYKIGTISLGIDTSRRITGNGGQS
jgi:hypothetical protein